MIPGASNVYNTANIDFPVKVSHPFVPDLNCLYMAQGKSPLETSNNTRTWKKKQIYISWKRTAKPVSLPQFTSHQTTRRFREKKQQKYYIADFKCFEFLKPITKGIKDPALLITKRCFIII